MVDNEVELDLNNTITYQVPYITNIRLFYIHSIQFHYEWFNGEMGLMKMNSWDVGKNHHNKSTISTVTGLTNESNPYHYTGPITMTTNSDITGTWKDSALSVDIPINDGNYEFTHVSVKNNNRNDGRVILSRDGDLDSRFDCIINTSHQHAGFHIFVEKVDFSDNSQRDITTKPTTTSRSGSSIAGLQLWGYVAANWGGGLSYWTSGLAGTGSDSLHVDYTIATGNNNIFRKLPFTIDQTTALAFFGLSDDNYTWNVFN